MKECPNCCRVFQDDSLRFCRFDGTRLVMPAVAPDEAKTILFTTGQLKIVLEEEPRSSVKFGNITRVGKH